MIEESGPCSLTFARVADTLGVTAGALAQRFGSKDQMVAASSS